MFKRHRIIPILTVFLLTSCASTYSFNTQPSGATVYRKSDRGKEFLGETPFEFSKSSLPDGQSFSVFLEKEGYESKEISVLPTNQTTTIVRANLKRLENDNAGADRTRRVLRDVFKVQELVQKKNYVEAMSALNALQEREPKLPEVYVLRGSVLMVLKRPQEAKGQWEKAIALDANLDDVKAKIAAIAKQSQSK